MSWKAIVCILVSMGLFFMIAYIKNQSTAGKKAMKVSIMAAMEEHYQSIVRQAKQGSVDHAQSISPNDLMGYFSISSK